MNGGFRPSLLTNGNDFGIIRVLRLSLKRIQETKHVILCICRGKSERDVRRAIDNGAATLRDLQRCGIGDQCGSCNNNLRTMLAQAAVASAATQQPCPACIGTDIVAAVATA